MTIKCTDTECTLKGFGGGKGTIEGKGSVEKGIIPMPNLNLR